MGCGGSKAKSGNTDKNTLSILMLGISGCGKSTFTKQMKIISDDSDFQDFELENFKKIILRNLTGGISEVLKYMKDRDEVSKISEENQEIANNILNTTSTDFSLELAKTLWSDTHVQKIWKTAKYSAHYAHLDYYMERMDMITKDDYVPNNEDIVRLRQHTIGASTSTVKMGKYYWKFIDVGGQIPERQKWGAIVEKETLKAIIYFASLDDFDVPNTDSGDLGKTRLEVSQNVWVDTLKSEQFRRDNTVLFLNKMDLFEKQIQNKKQYKRFKKVFPEYKGEQNPEHAAEYVKNTFIDLAKDVPGEEQMFAHTLCAIDTKAVKLIWNTIVENVMRQRIAVGGFV